MVHTETICIRHIGINRPGFSQQLRGSIYFFFLCINFILFFFFKKIIYFNWRLITLQYCSVFFLPYIDMNQPTRVMGWGGRWKGGSGGSIFWERLHWWFLTHWEAVDQMIKDRSLGNIHIWRAVRGDGANPSEKEMIREEPEQQQKQQQENKTSQNLREGILRKKEKEWDTEELSRKISTAKHPLLSSSGWCWLSKINFGRVRSPEARY